MLNTILRMFIPNYTDTENPDVRQRYGVVSGAIGIALNLLLFAGKLAAGLISGAISVTADAFNNLSDAASSVVTLVGFRRPPLRPWQGGIPGRPDRLPAYSAGGGGAWPELL